MRNPKTKRASKPAKPTSAKGPISHVPGRKLVVSTQARFPQTADEKVVTAKSIIQAVVAAHDSETLADENYDIHSPLSLAIDLLEQASLQLEASA